MLSIKLYFIFYFSDNVVFNSKNSGYFKITAVILVLQAAQ